MKMKMKIYLGVITYCCLNATAIADEATAGQAVTVGVDKVMLISLDSAVTPSLSPTPPTVAGQNFGSWVVTDGFSGLLVTSNVSTAVLKVKSNFDFSAENIALGVTLTNRNSGAGGSASLTDTAEETLGTVGSIVTGTDRSSSPLKISYSASAFNPTSTQVPSYGTYNATLTYTISEP